MQIFLPVSGSQWPPIRRSLKTTDGSRMLRRLESLVRGFSQVRDDFQFRNGCFYGGWDAHRGEPGFVSYGDLVSALRAAGFTRIETDRFDVLLGLFDDSDDCFPMSKEWATWLSGNEVITLCSDTSDNGKHVAHRLVFSLLDPVLKVDFFNDIKR